MSLRPKVLHAHSLKHQRLPSAINFGMHPVGGGDQSLKLMDLPSDIIHRPLVKQLFILGKMELACKLLLRWAETSHGATEIAGQSQNDRDAFQEHYWREAFKLYFYSRFKQVTVDAFPTLPFHGQTWRANFIELCREINTHQQEPHRAARKRVTIARFQKVEWTQRKLDEWLDRFTRGTAPHLDFPRLVEILLFAGANPTGMPHWRELDRQLKFQLEWLEEFGRFNPQVSGGD